MVIQNMLSPPDAASTVVASAEIVTEISPRLPVDAELIELSTSACPSATIVPFMASASHELAKTVSIPITTAVVALSAMYHALLSGADEVKGSLTEITVLSVKSSPVSKAILNPSTAGSVAPVLPPAIFTASVASTSPTPQS